MFGISSLNLPWLLIRDLNTILTDSEHRERNFDNYANKSMVLNSFLPGDHLVDLGFIGPKFTWCNGQSGLARRWATLDKFPANTEWISHFEYYANKHLARTLSDHSMLFLKARLFAYRKSRIFRFDNYWLDYSGCHEAVINAWNATPNGSPLHA